ncbi:hypothetical protein QTP88_023475 [Uroleucon formosanum]
MSEVNEQRVCIKFCLKLGKNATETYEMIKTAFGDDSLSRSKIFEWFKRFKNGRETTEDDPRSGRPSTSRNDDVVSKICEKVRNDRRLTVRELADEAGISIGSCHEILTENLQMRRVAAKFVPRLLTLEQKENRLTICQDLKNRSIDPNFIKNIVTGDETWVYGYDPETKAQSSQWKTKFSPRPKKARQVRSSVKTMLIVFFDIEGIVHYEFVPHGQTVNQVFYKDVLMRLREKIRKKRPEKWRTETWFLHHDNAPAHSALSIREFLADKKIPVVPHPPYSPDLAPCDFFLFPKLKFALKGQRFQDVEEIKANTAAELKVLTSEQFQRTFEKWQDRWNHCILSGGEYFEAKAFGSLKLSVLKVIVQLLEHSREAEEYEEGTHAKSTHTHTQAHPRPRTYTHYAALIIRSMSLLIAAKILTYCLIVPYIFVPLLDQPSHDILLRHFMGAVKKKKKD